MLSAIDGVPASPVGTDISAAQQPCEYIGQIMLLWNPNRACPTDVYPWKDKSRRKVHSPPRQTSRRKRKNSHPQRLSSRHVTSCPSSLPGRERWRERPASFLGPVGGTSCSVRLGRSCTGRRRFLPHTLNECQAADK